MNKPLEMPSAYDSKAHEDVIYSAWESSGLFNPEACIKAGVTKPKATPFVVMMPPPNVTGILHLGHALEQALMDTRVRFERMRGKRTLWIPGTDHAAVATQARVERDLIEQGIKNPREALGREELLKRIRAYAEQSKTTILSQIRKLGSSCDWSRLVYTFDEKRSKTVTEVFRRMYDAGLIYRGHRVVNWSVAGQSTTSDDELVHVERAAKLYTFKYGPDFPIPIATTRPETKLGDTAVAVHPDDARYKKFIGQKFTADVGAQKPLLIQIIGDGSVDPDFGTGALGVTPAHSQVDFEMSERHQLPLIQVIGTDGRMTAEAGAAYEGQTVEEARKKFVSWLRERKLLISEEETQQNVATSDRFGDVVEALPMLQWFIAVNKKIPGRNKTLKDLMREAVATGHKGKKSEKISITPDRYEAVYFHWIDNLRDWCISRQIWWGHCIPVWYGPDKKPVVSETSPGAGFTQDPDTLDTWFSSGTWTFSTLGWPDAEKKGKKTGDLAMYHPTDWMQMGYELLFFWMARMILMSTFILDEIPFREVYIHGLVRDKEGKKYSKSLRNTIDPLDLIEKYGTDALRLSLIANVTPGNDTRFYEEKVEHYQHFVNKLWNISRYILGGSDAHAPSETFPRGSSIADQWILNRLGNVMNETTKKLSQSDFSSAAQLLYAFTWNDLADWYIEAAKIEGRSSPEIKEQKQELLRSILGTLLRLWHPFIPFVTEAIAAGAFSEGSLMVSAWPEKAPRRSEKADVAFTSLQDAVVTIRNYKAEHDIPAATRVTVAMALPFKGSKELIEGLARCTVEETKDGGIRVQATSTMTEAKRAELQHYIERLEKKLSDTTFTKNAPAAIVDQERKKLEEARKKLGLTA